MVLETVVERLKQGLARKSSAVPAVSNLHQLDDCLETVVQWIAARYGKEYFVAPLDDFAAKFGKSFSEDPFYQDRMNYFLEYSVLECLLKGNSAGLTPLRAYLDQMTGRSLQSPELWNIFGEFRHSVFEVVLSDASQLILKDLQNGRKYLVKAKSGETLKYLARKMVFQGFLFGANGVHYLGQGMIAHPERARRPLIKFLKQKQKVGPYKELDILKNLAHTNMRYLRMQHVDPANMYRQYLV